MALYDIAADLRTFHDVYVKLDAEHEKELVRVRDLNLSRIRDGLDDLERPGFKTWIGQGGYAMRTVVNDPLGLSNHDIDVAVIFDEGDLPTQPLLARQRVRDALLKRASNFAEDPEARRNAVTVWYADGYHCDFAVYRRRPNGFGGFSYEHASTDWIERDPSEVTGWFDGQVTVLSPAADLWGNKPAVAASQLRRVVRLAKWFSRSRSSWDLPGGMIMSALVVECYRPDRDRDDLALYNTLAAIRARLALNCHVYHPLGGGRELTGADRYLKQVERLKEQLDTHLPKLAILEVSDCTRAQARSAWDWIFNHTFWAGQEVLAETASLQKADITVQGQTVAMACSFSGRGGRQVPYRQGVALSRGLGLSFSLTATTVQAPYDIRYEVKNTGEEARAARNLEWAGNASSYAPTWTTSTAFAGRHRMTCNVVKNGVTLASTSMIVTIGGKGPRGGLRG